MSESIKRRERDAVLQSLQAGLVPKLGLHLIQVGRKQEVAALLSDLERIEHGGAAFRIIVGHFGSGKSFFVNLVRTLALQRRLVVAQADSFSYTDPVDGSVSSNQGLRILFEGGSRIVFRLSGTGTEGATLRVYLEAYQQRSGVLDAETPIMLADLIAAADALAGIARHTGRTAPDVVT